jgi:hypothetical protein
MTLALGVYMGESTRAIDYTGQERAALVAWHLAHGDGLTTRQVSEIVGLSWDNAHRLMLRLSRVLPIYQDKHVWQVCALREIQ